MGVKPQRGRNPVGVGVDGGLIPRGRRDAPTPGCGTQPRCGWGEAFEVMMRWVRFPCEGTAANSAAPTEFRPNSWSRAGWWAKSQKGRNPVGVGVGGGLIPRGRRDAPTPGFGTQPRCGWGMGLVGTVNSLGRLFRSSGPSANPALRDITALRLGRWFAVR